MNDTKQREEFNWKDHELDFIWHHAIQVYARGKIDKYELLNRIENQMEKAIDKALSNNTRETIEKVGEGLDKTFKGCACGLHGYQLLPDCIEEKHGVEDCAYCFLQTLK